VIHIINSAAILFLADFANLVLSLAASIVFSPALFLLLLRIDHLVVHGSWLFHSRSHGNIGRLLLARLLRRVNGSS
jgi:hypothetical protein